MQPIFLSTVRASTLPGHPRTRRLPGIHAHDVTVEHYAPECPAEHCTTERPAEHRALERLTEHRVPESPAEHRTPECPSRAPARSSALPGRLHTRLLSTILARALFFSQATLLSPRFFLGLCSRTFEVYSSNHREYSGLVCI